MVVEYQDYRSQFSWPTAADYDDEEDYDLEDPKSTNQKDPSKWKEVNLPKEIEFHFASP
jgi:hypothetical protein